jgi:hypothetical protein
MYLKFFFNLVLIIALAAFQIGFVSGLPAAAHELNLVVIFLVFSLEFSPDKRFIWWLLLLGFVFDIYFPFFFGFFIILWTIIFLFANFLSVNFFTNRSLYSFSGLAFFSIIFYYFCFNSLFYLASIMSGEKASLFFLAKNFWLKLGEGVALNLVAAIILFYLVNLISDRLKPVFIIREHRA